MEIDTPEEAAAKNDANWATLADDLEALAEQCCDEFYGEGGTFQDFADDHYRNIWRKFAKYLWGHGARPGRLINGNK